MATASALKFLFLESFYGGSHARFADGLAAFSRHHIDLRTLPGRYWKWRMLGSALYFAETVPDMSGYDGLIVTDLFNLSDFLAIRGQNCPPVLVYFHENQVTYPPPPGDKGAFQTGMINISTALAARRLIFNSDYHRQAFLRAIPDFLAKGRDCRPAGTAAAVAAKAGMLYPGIRPPARPPAEAAPAGDPPLIVWNHRWAFDKNYELFLSVLNDLATNGIPFQLALLGQNDGRIPPAFAAAREKLQAAIVRFGYVKSRQEYRDWLRRGAIVVSTARQENFGLAVIEAMARGCLPLLPRRLAYPEILPPDCHQPCLFDGRGDLTRKLTDMLTAVADYRDIRRRVSRHAAAYCWPRIIDDYDRELENLAVQDRSDIY